MSKSASLENTPGPVVLPTPEVQQAQQLLARQQLLVAMDRARHAASGSPAAHELVPQE